MLLLQDDKFMVMKIPLKPPGHPMKWWECSISVNDNVGGNCFVVESQGPKLELMANVNHCDLNCLFLN